MPALDADRVIAALRGAFARDVGRVELLRLAAERIRAAGAPVHLGLPLHAARRASWCSRRSPGARPSTPASPSARACAAPRSPPALDQNVPDVRAIDNYIACNTWTRSELVVLIRRGAHDPGPDRHRQRRARPVHARRGSGRPEGGGRPGRPALAHARVVVRPVHHRLSPTATGSPSPSTPGSATRSSPAACCRPPPSRSPTGPTAGRSSWCTPPATSQAVLDGTLTPAEVRRLGFPWSPRAARAVAPHGAGHGRGGA